MHELSLAQSILEIVNDYAEKHRFKHVNSLNLTLGRLSCIETSTLTFAFDLQAKDSCADGAKLNFTIFPPRIHCISCNRELEVKKFESICPRCNSPDITLIGGTEELKLIDLDVD